MELMEGSSYSIENFDSFQDFLAIDSLPMEANLISNTIYGSGERS